MKKVLAVVLVVALVLSMFSGCAPSEDKKPSTKPKIGMFTMGANESPTFKAMDLSISTVAKAAGIDLAKVELTSYGDEGFLTAYETLAAQGVDGAIVYTFSESVLPLVANLLEKSAVKYFVANRKIADGKIKEDVYDNPNFVGNDYCSETQVAYDIVKHLHEKYGAKNLAIIGLQKGDVNGDLRDLGIKKACDEFGIKILNETRGVINVEDVTNAVNGFAGAYPEMDSIFIVGGAVTPGGLAGVTQALINNKLTGKVNVGMIDIESGMGEFMDEGPLKIVAGGNLIFDQVLSMIALANEVKGTPLSDKAFVLNTKMLYITNKQAASDYEKYVESPINPIFTEEDLKKNFFKFENSNVTLESIQKIINDFTIESLKASREGK